MNQILRSFWNVLLIIAIGFTIHTAAVLAGETNVSRAVFYVA